MAKKTLNIKTFVSESKPIIGYKPSVKLEIDIPDSLDEAIERIGAKKALSLLQRQWRTDYQNRARACLTQLCENFYAKHDRYPDKNSEDEAKIINEVTEYMQDWYPGAKEIARAKQAIIEYANSFDDPKEAKEALKKLLNL